MYINVLMKYQLHQGYMFRPKTVIIRPQNMFCIGLMMAVLRPKHVALM